MSVMAQEAKDFSLTEALDFALEHNAQMINADRDVQAAYAQKWSTIAIGLPQISASGSYQNQLKDPSLFYLENFLEESQEPMFRSLLVKNNK